MSEQLDPKILFELIAAHVPADLRPNILIVGSLAAAYHHRDQIQNHAINTKDVDVVIQPAGAIEECRAIAERLLAEKWRHVTDAEFAPRLTPDGNLPAIRLCPPKSDAYFIEFLAFPAPEQRESKAWTPIKLGGGWYGLPSFRFMGLIAHDRQTAPSGLTYASPAMMALANLLSHPTLGIDRVKKTIGDRALLRSAKDLGRVLALARLASREETEAWATRWATALIDAFPHEYRALAVRAGNGLRMLLDDPEALDEARHAINVLGLLAGHQISTEELKAIGRQLFLDAVEPLSLRCAQR